jgi:hypothetical protein
MSTRSIEAGGDTPNNRGLSDINVLPEQRGVGPRVQKPEEPKQQISDPKREAFERFLRRTPMRPAVLEGIPPSWQNVEGNQPTPQKPSEERGQSQQSKSTPEGQQTPQRRRRASEQARLAQDPELRGLAKELFGSISDQAASKFVAMAAQDYPDLPPDEALRKFDRERREHPNRGFTFS